MTMRDDFIEVLEALVVLPVYAPRRRWELTCDLSDRACRLLAGLRSSTDSAESHAELTCDCVTQDEHERRWLEATS